MKTPQLLNDRIDKMTIGRSPPEMQPGKRKSHPTPLQCVVSERRKTGSPVLT
jgi:hypothetical protein